MEVFGPTKFPEQLDGIVGAQPFRSRGLQWRPCWGGPAQHCPFGPLARSLTLVHALVSLVLAGDVFSIQVQSRMHLYICHRWNHIYTVTSACVRQCCRSGCIWVKSLQERPASAAAAQAGADPLMNCDVGAAEKAHAFRSSLHLVPSPSHLHAPMLTHVHGR